MISMERTFIFDFSPYKSRITSKKRRYAKSAMSLVGRDISAGFFKTLKAATLIIIEDEIENETSQTSHIFSSSTVVACR